MLADGGASLPDHLVAGAVQCYDRAIRQGKNGFVTAGRHIVLLMPRGGHRGRLPVEYPPSGAHGQHKGRGRNGAPPYSAVPGRHIRCLNVPQQIFALRIIEHIPFRLKILVSFLHQ